MWRQRVLHATGYAYPSPATASYNEARLTPRSDSRQNVVLNRVETVPATRSYRYVDYWGTAVTAFDLHAPHTELTVTSASVVETEQPDPVTEKLSWSDLAHEAVIDRYDELLRPTDYTPTSKRIAAVGKRIIKEHEPADAVIGETVDGQSHAWIQAWTGSWWDHDPTNDTEINEQYVTVGVGRDYADVSPLKGIYHGQGATDLDVVVEMTRLA